MLSKYLTTKNKTMAFEFGLIGIVAAIALYLAGVVQEETMWTILAFFGSGSITALRSLFLSEGNKTNLIFLIGSLVQAAFLYGNLTGLRWADPEKLTFLNQIILGVQGLNAGHGIAKANGFSAVGNGVSAASK